MSFTISELLDRSELSGDEKKLFKARNITIHQVGYYENLGVSFSSLETLDRVLTSMVKRLAIQLKIELAIRISSYSLGHGCLLSFLGEGSYAVGDRTRVDVLYANINAQLQKKIGYIVDCYCELTKQLAGGKNKKGLAKKLEKNHDSVKRLKLRLGSKNRIKQGFEYENGNQLYSGQLLTDDQLGYVVRESVTEMIRSHCVDELLHDESTKVMRKKLLVQVLEVFFRYDISRQSSVFSELKALKIFRVLSDFTENFNVQYMVEKLWEQGWCREDKTTFVSMTEVLCALSSSFSWVEFILDYDMKRVCHEVLALSKQKSLDFNLRTEFSATLIEFIKNSPDTLSEKAAINNIFYEKYQKALSHIEKMALVRQYRSLIEDFLNAGQKLKIKHVHEMYVAMYVGRGIISPRHKTADRSFNLKRKKNRVDSSKGKDTQLILCLSAIGKDDILYSRNDLNKVLSIWKILNDNSRDSPGVFFEGVGSVIKADEADAPQNAQEVKAIIGGGVKLNASQTQWLRHVYDSLH